MYRLNQIACGASWIGIAEESILVTVDQNEETRELPGIWGSFRIAANRNTWRANGANNAKTTYKTGSQCRGSSI